MIRNSSNVPCGGGSFVVAVGLEENVDSTFVTPKRCMLSITVYR